MDGFFEEEDDEEEEEDDDEEDRYVWNALINTVECFEEHVGNSFNVYMYMYVNALMCASTYYIHGML